MNARYRGKREIKWLPIVHCLCLLFLPAVHGPASRSDETARALAHELIDEIDPVAVMTLVLA